MPDQFSVLQDAMRKHGFPHFKDQAWVDPVDIDAYEAHISALVARGTSEVVEALSNPDDSPTS